MVQEATFIYVIVQRPTTTDPTAIPPLHTAFSLHITLYTIFSLFPRVMPIPNQTFSTHLIYTRIYTLATVFCFLLFLLTPAYIHTGKGRGKQKGKNDHTSHGVSRFFSSVPFSVLSSVLGPGFSSVCIGR
ncbi:hypothetical protein F4778DRAFT_474226 [Xylariomycetidae sp. FL2044]|nr:hypothetical protein F4778DRAFT_474226 [Xylariomycetidae sp. FL2044]